MDEQKQPVLFTQKPKVLLNYSLIFDAFYLFQKRCFSSPVPSTKEFQLRTCC